MLQSNMGYVASRDTHSRSSKKPSLPLQKPTPSLSQYLPRPSQREGARACGPGECCIASALAVNTARGVERASRLYVCIRGLVCGVIWRDFECASRLHACIRGNVCGDIWRNIGRASRLYVCVREFLRGDIRKNIGRVSHFCARICGNVCGDIWRNTEFASGVRSPPLEGLGEVFLFSKTASSASSTFSTLFVVFFCSCSCSLFLETLTG